LANVELEAGGIMSVAFIVVAVGLIHLFHL